VGLNERENLGRVEKQTKETTSYRDKQEIQRKRMQGIRKVSTQERQERKQRASPRKNQPHAYKPKKNTTPDYRPEPLPSRPDCGVGKKRNFQPKPTLGEKGGKALLTTPLHKKVGKRKKKKKPPNQPTRGTATYTGGRIGKTKKEKEDVQEGKVV